MRSAYILCFIEAFAVAQNSIPGLDPVQICRAAPCHAVYVEKGVLTVNQTRISGPITYSNGHTCCGYDAFTQSVDPPTCCWDASGNLVDAESRFSCPLRAVTKPANCDKAIEKDTQEKCLARSKRFEALCRHTSGFASFGGRICPTQSFKDLGAFYLEKAVGRLRTKFTKNPKSESKLDKFKSDFFGVVGASLGIGFLAVEAPVAGTITAAVVLAYKTYCDILTGLSVLGSICEEIRINFPLNEGCSKLPSRSTDITPVEAVRMRRQEDNPCTEVLAYLPGVSECGLAASSECSTNEADYLSVGLSAAQASQFASGCVDVNAEIQSILKLCAIRDAVVAIEPLCGPGEYIAPEDVDEDPTTTTPTISLPSAGNTSTTPFYFNTTFILPTTALGVPANPAITTSCTLPECASNTKVPGNELPSQSSNPGMAKPNPNNGIDGNVNKNQNITTTRPDSSERTKTSPGQAINSMIQFRGGAGSVSPAIGGVMGAITVATLSILFCF